jgi:hypothetical protein
LQRPAGKIRLREGDDTYGKKHIELRHGDGIRKRGYPSVEASIQQVARNFDAIYRRGTDALYVVLSEGDHGRMIVRLEPDASGAFYDVKTAMPSRDDQFKNADLQKSVDLPRHERPHCNGGKTPSVLM